MNSFCESTFWDVKKIWYTNEPEFGQCFEKIVLGWISCIFLWMWFPFEYSLLRSKKSHSRKYSTYSIIKLGAISLIIYLSSLGIILNIFKKDGKTLNIYWFAGLFITYILFFALSIMHIEKKIASPGVSFLFSFFTIFFGLPQIRSEINFMETTSSKYASWEAYVYVTIYVLQIILFFLSFFADSALTNKDDNPEKRASFLSKIGMFWMYPYVWKNYKNTETFGNLWSVSHRTTIRYSLPIFKKISTKCEDTFKSKRKSKKTPVQKMENMQLNHALFKMSTPFFKTVIIANVTAGISVASAIQFISYVINFMTEDNFEWHGYFYSILLLLLITVTVVSVTTNHREIYKMKLCLDTFLSSIIYRKAIRLSTAAQKTYDNSKIIDLMTTEANSLTNGIAIFSKLFMALVTTFFCLIYVTQILGINVLILLVMLIILLIVEEITFKNINKNGLTKKIIARKRLNLVQDVLNGFKMLKLYAWETAFEKEILNYRNAEMKLLAENKKCETVLGSLWFTFSISVILCPVMSAILLNDESIFTIQQIFCLVGLINSMTASCLTFPEIIYSIITIKYSLEKISSFLNAEERYDKCSVEDNDNGYALSIENGTFSWYSHKRRDKEILHNINIRVAKQELVAVIGPLGSGKTSLLLAFLAELYISSGKVNKMGTVAFSAQQPWILNNTIRENIIMSKPFDEKFYDTVVEACALSQDIESFRQGSLTMIGEKGINLSGGQKQRISLARAVYANADVYLLDDVFSALDISVASHIFRKVIGPQGLLKEKTRVVVTHNMQFLPQVDTIIILENKTIARTGSYQDLKNTDENFKTLMNKISNKDEIKEENIGIDDIMNNRINIKPENMGEEIDSKFIRPKFNSKKIDEIETAITKLSSIEKSKNEKGVIALNRDIIQRGALLMPVIIVLMCILYHVFRISINVSLAYWSMQINNIHVTSSTYLEIFGAVVISSFTICYIYQTTISRTCFNISRHAHDKLLSTVMKWPLVLFEAIPSSKIIHRFGLYLNILDDRTSSLFIGVVLIKQFQIFITLFFAAYINPFFLLMIALSFSCEYIIQKLAENYQRRLVEEISKQTSIISAHTLETLLGLASIRAMNLQLHAIQKLDEMVERKSTLQNNYDQYWMWVMTQKFMCWGVLTFVGILSIIFEKQDPIEISGFVVVSFFTMMHDFQTCDKLNAHLKFSINSLRRIAEFIRTPCENLTEKNSVRETWPERGTIEFKNLKVRYRRSGTFILKGLSFRVNSGERVGVIGRTGAGKTSMISSIFRMTEFVNGSIEIDGVDISTIALHDLRSKLTVIPQDPVLFSGSLRLNLDPLKEHSDEKLWTVLEQAHLRSFMNQLPNKLDHVIEAGGENISLGQKQLICLARALLRKTNILILDEATASVDLDTDALIQSTIQSEFRHCTVLTIAHRIQTVFNYDKILVLENGCVMEFESPSNLIQNENSIFHKLAKIAQLI